MSQRAQPICAGGDLGEDRAPFQIRIGLRHQIACLRKLGQAVHQTPVMVRIQLRPGPLRAQGLERCFDAFDGQGIRLNKLAQCGVVLLFLLCIFFRILRTVGFTILGPGEPRPHPGVGRQIGIEKFFHLEDILSVQHRHDIGRTQVHGFFLNHPILELNP